MTLVELMMALAIMMFVVAGAMGFIIASARHNRSNMDRSDLLRGGRVAMNVIKDEIENAGLGLPRWFAIRSFVDTGTECASTPELEVVALELTQQWTVSAAASTSLTLDSPTPTPASAPDVAIPANQWLFVYKSATVDAAGTADGHGLVRVATARAAGASTITLVAASATLDLNQADLDAGSGGHPTVVLRARTSRFGVDCTDATKPYVFWERNDSDTLTPLASYADTRPLAAANAALDAVVSDILALRFRFLVDTNADGRSDDQNADGVIDALDLITAPTDLSQVTAIEVLMRLRAGDTDPSTDTYRTQDFVELVRTHNINTKYADFVFIDNTGL